MSEIDTSERDQYFASMLDIIEKGTKLLSQRIEDEEMKDLYQDIEIPLITVLGDMEYNGIAVDKSILDKLKIQFEKEISALQAEIYDLAQEEFNISSPKQLGVILFEKLSLPAIKKTKTGYSTNAEVLEYLMDKHPIIEKILQYRQFTKLQSTYVEGLLKIINPITGRIHSNFNQTIAATGRISSTDPNLQNIPVRLEIGRELRKVFVSKKGSLLVDADYSQIELRVLASMSSDEDMIDAFSGDTDIHTSTASEVFGVPVDQVTKSQRGAAKAVNFGIVYGISDFGLANNLGIDLKTAKDYIETYLSRYPGIKKYMDDIIKFGEEKGYVVTLLGRRRYIPELQAKNFVVKNLGKRLAMNTPIQGSAADIIKIAMVKVHKRLQEEQLNSRLVLQVHDELLIEADEKEVTIIRGLIAEEMENAVHMKVKLSVDVESGKSWYDTK